MAWEPKDPEKFKAAYLAGRTDSEFEKDYGVTEVTVGRYVRKERAKGNLPKRREISDIETNIEHEALDLRVLRRLKSAKQAVDIHVLCDELDCPPKDIHSAIERLQLSHHLVSATPHVAMLSQPKSGGKTLIHGVDEYLGAQEYKFGVISDNHMGSKYARPDIDEALYDIFVGEGVKDVYHCGNWIDGEARFNRSDLEIHGMGNQIHHFAKNYPAREGITTHFIAGDDHEGWYTQSAVIDIGQYAQMIAEDRYGREDLKYLGYMEHDVHIPTKKGETIIRVLHAGGGSAYAISYTLQKIVEALSGGDKPHVLLTGHYHKQGTFFIRNVHAVLAGCTQAQTPFMRKRRLAACLGGYVITLKLADDGSILRFLPEFIPFYDSGRLSEKWQYKMLG